MTDIAAAVTISQPPSVEERRRTPKDAEVVEVTVNFAQQRHRNPPTVMPHPSTKAKNPALQMIHTGGQMGDPALIPVTRPDDEPFPAGREQ
ncbi:hypothetical protein K2224_39550 (plasmid) [Streptomyces sp. BHT-5-2]|uniref:hypothetical protein n=1 Tax=Streptomyces sp. BHT-5-2 TaxID=2866715 RepID=UPI001C8EB457|nr:hypothetical protein [Streptomyces sp. BHT-5-2]QZL09062.1 hypothetical protein K2224_39550 [Streptomyces sp. BHT-5-2]